MGNYHVCVYAICKNEAKFARRWMDRVDLFLDPYSTDQWWTEDMRAAFALYCQHKNEPEELTE